VSPANPYSYSTTAIALDPTDPNVLYASANNVSSPHVVGFGSGDGGGSWGVTIPPRADSGPTAGTFFPSSVFDSRGELYQAYMTYAVSGSQLQSQIVVARSTNKGETWEHAAVVEPPASGPERPSITVDRGSGRFHNRLYVAYNTNPSPNASPIVVAHSDNGLSWTRTTVDPNVGFAAVPAVAPDGTVYVVWDDWCYPFALSQCGLVGDAAKGAIKLARSTDGGATFSPPAIVQFTTRGFGTRVMTASNCPVEWWVTATPSLVIDPRSGTLYLAYTDGPNGWMHVFAGRSTDGVNFTGWTSVAGTDSTPAWQGTLAVDPTNGVVGLSYYFGAPQYTPYYTESLDGTNWVAKPIPLATASDTTLGCTGTGDYMQMVLNNGVAHPLWVDTRNGHDQVFTRTVDEALAAPPPPLPRPVNPALFQSPLQTGDVAFSGVATGDFDGDGKVDLAYPGWDSSGTHQGIYFRHGSGDGTFGAPIFTQSPSTPFFGALNSPVAANIDGKLDLVMSGSVSSPTLGTCQGIIMVPGNGDGTFSFAKAQWQCVQGYGSIAVADFDHDRRPDVAIAANGGIWVSLTKAGVLQTSTRVSSVNAWTVVAADVNGDGNQDLVAAGPAFFGNSWTGVVQVLLGDGTGAFPTAKTIPSVGLQPNRVAVGDFNGDGKLDLAVEEIDFQWPRVFLQIGDGTFTESTGAFENLGAQPRGDKGILAGDFNADGKQDIIYGNAIWQGKGDGTFAYYGPTGVGSTWLGLGELNGDRYLDLLAANDAGAITLSLAINPPPPPPPPSVVTLSATALNFPTTTVGMASASQVVTARYTGPVQGSVGVPVIAGTDPFDFTIVADSCIGATLPDKASCSVSVQFAPQTAGSHSATLEMPNNGPSTPQSVALTGTGAGSSQDFYRAVGRDQFQLTSSDGANWVPLDSTNLVALITPAADSSAIIGGSADLWTAIAGVNQDIGVLIAGGAYGNGQVVAWKESGGSAGTYSPNAAFVQTVQDLKANTSYVIALMWKTNRPISSGTIFTGAGQRPGFSPTSLTVQLVPGASPYPPSVTSVASTTQYHLSGSDGATWTDMDPALSILFTPTVTGSALISGNADLWTSTAGYNQDIAINVDGTIASWKESGGFAGTYSPNAAFVQAVPLQMTAGTHHTVKLQWKANRRSPANAQIWAGAGPIGSHYSPTRLTIYFTPSGVNSTYGLQQYHLTGSDGMTWQSVDPEPTIQNRLRESLYRFTQPCSYLISANVDLWTSQAGYNQDIGISVSGGSYPTVPRQPEAWKESGGFAGTFSPNAAYVETVVTVVPQTTYDVTVTWKTNKPANGATIWAGAGPDPPSDPWTGYSPSRLTVQPLC